VHGSIVDPDQVSDRARDGTVASLVWPVWLSDEGILLALDARSN
jgi:hypothetical protein